MPSLNLNSRFYAAEATLNSEHLMSGAISARIHDRDATEGYGANSNPMMDTTSACEKVHVEPARKAHEKDWQELRQRLERKIASAAQALNGKHEQGTGDRPKPRWPLGTTTPQGKEPQLFTVNSEDKITIRAPNPRTGVISPSNRTDSSQEDGALHQRSSQKWKLNGDQWISVDVNHSPSQTPPKGHHVSKDSSIPVPDMLIGDWEDRFVVNMPSAKEPNPPSMTPQQIQRYQEKVERDHLLWCKIHEIDTRAKNPASTINDEMSPTPTRGKTSIPVARKGVLNATITNSKPPVSPSSSARQYFSPDEVGRTRVSSIQEDSHEKPEDLYNRIRQECFLGCMDMDQIYAKNPDEILLFPNMMEERFRYSPLPSSLTSSKTAAKGPRPKRLSENEKAVASEQGPSARTTRPPLDLKQRIASEAQKPHSQPSLAQRTRTLTIPPSRSVPKPMTTRKENEVEVGNREEDDVFIVTPTITRVMVPTTISRSATQPSYLPRLPNGAGTTCANSHTEVGSYTCPNLLFAGRSNVTCLSTPATKHGKNIHKESTTDSTAPGHTHTSHRTVAQVQDGGITSKQYAIVSEDCTVPTRSSSDASKLDTRDILENKPGVPGPRIQEIMFPEERPRHAIRTRGGKGLSVAELDGSQIHEQVDGVFINDSPFSQTQCSFRAQSNKETSTRSRSPVKKRAHSVKVEIKRKSALAGKDKAAEDIAGAKRAAERLAAARKHAERLAEARTAYEKAKAQKAISQKVPLETSSSSKLRERKLAAEKIAEAQAAYKEAEARKAASEKTREQVSPPSTPTPATKPKPKARQSEGQIRGKNTVEKNKERGFTPFSMEGWNLPDFSLLLGIFLLSSNQIHVFLRRHRMFGHVVVFSEQFFEMASHCLRVLKRLFDFWQVHRQTGSWPESSSEELAILMRDVSLAGMYFMILGFVVMIVGRCAGYIVFVASWIVWFSRPFGWVFGRLLGGALFD